MVLPPTPHAPSLRRGPNPQTTVRTSALKAAIMREDEKKMHGGCESKGAPQG